MLVTHFHGYYITAGQNIIQFKFMIIIPGNFFK